MSDKMREEFEAWYCKKFTFENMARRADGTYRGEHAFNSWVSWQAALSQSEPKKVSHSNNFITHKDAWRSALVLCVKNAKYPTVDNDEPAYWMHEVKAFDDAYMDLSEPVQGDHK